MPVSYDDGNQCKVDGDDDHLRLWLETKSSFEQNLTINLLSTANGKTLVVALSKWKLLLVQCSKLANQLLALM